MVKIWGEEKLIQNDVKHASFLEFQKTEPRNGDGASTTTNKEVDTKRYVKSTKRRVDKRKF